MFVRRPVALASVILSSAVIAASCATPQAAPPAAPHPGALKQGDPSPLATWNAEARHGAVDETLHGVKVSDPYRALEADTPETQRWIERQTAYAAERIGAVVHPGLRPRLEALLRIGKVGATARGGSLTFFTARDGDREQPALFVSRPGSATPELLVDPIAHGARAALDYFYPSPKGRYVAFGLSSNGDERSTLHVWDVEKKALLPERITEAKWSNLAWLGDETGFYFTRYPREGEPNFDPKNPDSYFPRVFFHALGSGEADPLVFGSERGNDFPEVDLSTDDRHVIITLFRGWSASDVLLFDRGALPAKRAVAPKEPGGWVPVIAGEEAISTAAIHGNTLYLLTNLAAPRYRLLSAPVGKAADRTTWKTVVPEGPSPIEGWALTKGHHVLQYVEDVASTLRLVTHAGKDAGKVPVPPLSSVESLAASPTDSTLAFVVSGYTLPPELRTFDTQSRAEATPWKVTADYDFGALTVERVEVVSKDGTKIPVTIARRTDTVKDGARPVLLTGYGGFNVSLTPTFSRPALYWLERGGLYAVANLRGGGEFGETWHKAGNLGQKERVFEDFEAAVRWFSSSGWSNPSRIAITGGSNGGLLMGALITRAPESFQAAVAAVGLYDMVRYTKFPPAELWVSEYGDPNHAEHLRWLHAYSPYHRVKEGTAYPAVLVETADHDTRVHWAHSTKFAARLQEATSSARPILFFRERAMGHGRGTRLSDTVETQVRRFGFLEGALGVR